jgi:hypothetical protein
LAKNEFILKDQNIDRELPELSNEPEIIFLALIIAEI